MKKIQVIANSPFKVALNTEKPRDLVTIDLITNSAESFLEPSPIKKQPYESIERKTI